MAHPFFLTGRGLSKCSNLFFRNGFSSSVRLRWEYTPGSEMFLVYSDGRDTSLAAFPSVRNQSFVVKLTRLVRF